MDHRNYHNLVVGCCLYAAMKDDPSSTTDDPQVIQRALEIFQGGLAQCQSVDVDIDEADLVSAIKTSLQGNFTHSTMKDDFLDRLYDECVEVNADSEVFQGLKKIAASGRTLHELLDDSGQELDKLVGKDVALLIDEVLSNMKS